MHRIECHNLYIEHLHRGFGTMHKSQFIGGIKILHKTTACAKCMNIKIVLTLAGDITQSVRFR